MKSSMLIFTICQPLLIIILIFMPGMSYPQVFPERSFIYNPLLNDNNSAEGTRFMNSITAYGEFGHYLKDYESHAWNQKLGVYFEFFRTDNHTSLAFMSSIEFIADPNNDIKFNPRAVYWEEGFIFTKSAAGFFWQAGYTHRCKHDVDNLDYGEERSLIYGSILGRIIIPVNFKVRTLSSTAAFRIDLFTVIQDYRKPEPEQQEAPFVNKLTAAAGLNYNIYKYFEGSTAGIFLRNYLSAAFYSDKEGFVKRFSAIDLVKLNADISAGLFFNGKAGINAGIRYEYQHDTGLRIFPLSANLLSLFVAINNPLDFY